MVQRIITVDIPEKMDRLVENVARLLLYPSTEKFLEEAVVSLSLKTMLQCFDYYIDPKDIAERYGLVETEKTEKNENIRASATWLPHMIIKTLEDATDKISMCLQISTFQELLKENPVIERTIMQAQQSLVELKQEIEESKEKAGANPVEEGAPKTGEGGGED